VKNILYYLPESSEWFDSKLSWNVPWVVLYQNGGVFLHQLEMKNRLHHKDLSFNMRPWENEK